MSLIEIQRIDEEPEQRTLSKSQPLSVGTHTSNDVCVDEEGVALLHCRISWNKSAFEVVAADSRGVELNGKLVQHSMLRPGDVVRVGSLDITYLGDKGSGARSEPPVIAARAKSEVGLQPLSEETVGVADPPVSRRDPKKQRESRRDHRKSSRRAEEEVIDDLEIVEDEPNKRDLEVEGELGSRARRSGRREEQVAPIPAWKSQLATDRARPGEQEVLKSPFVLILGFGAAALLLAAGTFFFLNRRTSSSRLYEAATAEMEGGRYAQAIGLYDQFLTDFPNDGKRAEVAINRGRARIMTNTEGAVPLWSGGLKTLQEFIDENRDSSSFSDLNADLLKYGGKIALGAANTALSQKAEVDKRRETLAVSTGALGIVERFAPKDDPPTDLIRQIEGAVRAAEGSILKQQTFETSVASVEQAIGTSKPMSALESRRNLINQYPEFRSDPKVNTLLTRILETEKALVKQEPFTREAVTDERISLPSKPLTLALATRARTDVTSRGRVVIALAQDCCEGIDADTGDPVWRRVIGLDTPFFPLSVSATVPSLLMFDNYHRDLLLVEQETGKLVWRQPIEEQLAGAPLVDEGQIFLPTLGNHIYKFDLVSGRATVRLNFSQKVLAPPALDASRQRMVIAGDRDVFYTLSMRPFECVAVSFTGHEPGSIKAPLLTMGSLLLAAVNEKVESAQLRVFDTRNEKGIINEIGAVKVEGAVRDQPTLRGNQLFVTSSGLRISTFTVSDTQKPAVTPGPTFQGGSPYQGPVDLLAAQDGQLWMAADSLVKLQVTSNAITADSKPTAPGLSSQPLQSIGRELYVGRRAPSGDAVFLSRVERDDMVSQWRTVLGSTILATMPNEDGSLVVLAEDGSAYRVEESELTSGGFKKIAVSRLQLPEVPTQPLKGGVLFSRRIVAVSSEPPQLWLIDERGQIQRQAKLSKPLEASPIEIDQGIVLPMAGRLSLLSTAEAGTKVEDFVSPVGEGQAFRWTQLAHIDGTQFLALNDKGLLGRYQYRPEPVPHLDVAQSVQLEKPVDLPIEVSGGKVVLADASHRLLVLDATTLDTVASAPLDGPALSAPYVTKNRVYVATAESGLNCFDMQPELKKAWSAPLDKASLAGRPVSNEVAVVVALNNGKVLSLAAADGKVQGQLPLGQPLLAGPNVVGNHLVVSSIDGSLYLVEAVLKTVKP